MRAERLKGRTGVLRHLYKKYKWCARNEGLRGNDFTRKTGMASVISAVVGILAFAAAAMLLSGMVNAMEMQGTLPGESGAMLENQRIMSDAEETPDADKSYSLLTPQQYYRAEYSSIFSDDADINDPAADSREDEVNSELLTVNDFSQPMVTAAVVSETDGTFWADPDVGSGDVLYYGMVNGSQYPAYCIDHSLPVPSGSYDQLSTYSSKLVGYVMKKGYPNYDWGLEDAEAQYLTQIAVFGVLGIDIYSDTSGMHSLEYVYNALFGNGNLSIAEGLIADAQSSAVTADVAYATYWSPENGYSQRVVTPILTGKLKISKTVKNGTGSLTISKTTKGSESDADKQFTFTLVITKADGTVSTGKYSYTGSKSGTISGSSGTVKLAAGESITVTGLPAGSTYTVTETENSYYKTSPTSFVRTGTFASVTGTEKTFSFSVSFSDGGSYKYTGSKSGTIAGSGTVKLTGGQAVTFADVPAGVTYTVTETAVSTYTANLSGTTAQIKAGKTASAAFTNTYNITAKTASFTNTRRTGTLTVTKTTSSSDTTAQLEGNAMYSQDFSGAEFSVEVYDMNTKTWSDAVTYTTGSTGKFTVSGLYMGDKVRVTETKPPDGYAADSETQTITVAEGSNALTFKDTPVFDDYTMRINKIEMVNGEMVDGEIIAGAVFKVEYFDNVSRSGTAVRTWYFKTNSSGLIKYISTRLASGYESDELYTDAEGKANLPLGSIRVTEVEAPAGYVPRKAVITGTITQNSSTHLAVFKWLTANSSSLLKDGTAANVGNEKLSLGVLKIDKSTGRTVTGASLQLKKNGTALKTWTTTADVYYLDDLLEPGETYVLHERKAPSGYALAEDITFTVSSAGEITITDGSAATYEDDDGFLVIKMSDVKKIKMPLTGSSSGLWLSLSGIFLIGGSGLWMVIRRRRILEIVIACLCLVLLLIPCRLVKAEEKIKVPQLSKEVGEVLQNGEIIYSDAADSGFGRRIPYRITGGISENYKDYKKYEYIFHDSWEPGLEPDAESVKIVIEDASGNVKSDVTEFAEILIADGEMTAGFDNLKEVYPSYTDGDRVVMYYEAELTEEALTGSSSNDNEAWLEYSEHPDTDGLGITRRSSCRVYSWSLVLQKSGVDAELLPGATFTIQDERGKYLNTDGTVTEEKGDASEWTTTFDGRLNVERIDSGTYILTETEAPPGYEKADPVKITLTADYSDEEKITLEAVMRGNAGARVTGTEAESGRVSIEIVDAREGRPATGDRTDGWIYAMLALAALVALGQAIRSAVRGRNK